MEINISRALVHRLVRIRSACLLLCIALLAGPTSYSAPSEEPPLVRISSNSGGPFVGELLKGDEKTVELFDFQSNRRVFVSKTALTRIENPISLDAAAGYVGLPAVMGRQISLLSERQEPTGKIARIGTQIVYLTLGESSGVAVGQKVSVFRGEEDIRDPDTGKVLATERARIADLEISEVNQNVSKARLLGDLEIKLEIGDDVEPQGAKLIVAVCPLVNDSGSSNPTGNSIAEELTIALVQRKVSVVERSVLDKVLTELIAQNTILFDQKSAQQLGKLTGASMVLTGKIIQEKSSGKAHLRLIDVQTGEILLAVSAPVKLTARSSTSTSSTSTSSTGSKSGTSGSASSRGPTKSVAALHEQAKPTWLLKDVVKGAKLYSDRDYRFVLLPKDMRGAHYLLRDSEETKSWLPDESVTMEGAGTVYALVRWKYLGKENVDEVAFAQLERDGWTILEDAITTSFPPGEDWQWKALKKDLAEGDVILQLTTLNWGQRVVIFAFK